MHVLSGLHPSTILRRVLRFSPLACAFEMAGPQKILSFALMLLNFEFCLTKLAAAGFCLSSDWWATPAVLWALCEHPLAVLESPEFEVLLTDHLFPKLRVLHFRKQAANARQVGRSS
jgi:hypothetical protein